MHVFSMFLLEVKIRDLEENYTSVDIIYMKCEVLVSYLVSN